MEAQTQENKQLNERFIGEMMNQLGGHRFLVMTGSKPLYKDTTSANPLISLKLARNTSKATHLKITYNRSLDLYEMKFIRIHGRNMTTVKECAGLYSDMLQTTFTSVTGLLTQF